MNDEERANHETSVFISYSRKDKAFVQKLHEGIAAAGYDTWVDWEGIELTVDWWQEIQKGIENADAFAFVISPDSLTSAVCTDEIQWAVNNNKRLIPILHREPEEGNALHPKIASHNWVFMRDEAELKANLPQMLKVINTDLEWVQNHTRFQKRALEWNGNNQSSSFCLRGEDLTAAEAWLARGAEHAEQQPTELQIEYIQASRHDETRRQRLIRIASLTALAVFAVLFVFAVFQYFGAQRSEQEAVAARDVAEAESTRAFYSKGTAVAESTRAFNNEATAEAESTRAFYSEGTAVAAAATSDSNAEIAQQREEEAVAAQAAAEAARAEAEAAQQEAERNANEAMLQEQRANWERDEAIRQFQYERVSEEEQTYLVSFSPDGSRIVLSPETSTNDFVQIKDGDSGANIEDLLVEATSVNSVIFSSDGSRFITIEDFWVILWDAEIPTIIAYLPHDSFITSVYFSPDGSQILSASLDGTARLWSSETGEELAVLEGHTDAVTSAIFGPDGAFLTISDDGTVRLWDADADQVAVFQHSGAEIYSASFSPDGDRIVTASLDGQTFLWDGQTGDLIGQMTP